MPMRSMTREVAAVDANLRDLVTQLHDNIWDPDELGCIRDDIDEALDRRLVLTSGHARDRKSTRQNSSHNTLSRMPSSA